MFWLRIRVLKYYLCEPIGIQLYTYIYTPRAISLSSVSWFWLDSRARRVGYIYALWKSKSEHPPPPPLLWLLHRQVSSECHYSDDEAYTPQDSFPSLALLQKPYSYAPLSQNLSFYHLTQDPPRDPPAAGESEWTAPEREREKYIRTAPQPPWRKLFNVISHARRAIPHPKRCCPPPSLKAIGPMLYTWVE